MTILGALTDAAQGITTTTGGAVRATVAPEGAYAPCVVLTATGIDADGVTGRVGCYVVDVRAEIRPGSAGADALAWAWDTALPAVHLAVGLERASVEITDDGTPAVVVYSQIKTT